MATIEKKTGLAVVIGVLGVMLCAGNIQAATGEGLSNIFTIDNRGVGSLVGEYQGVFIEGIDVINTFIAEVDWSGKTPSTIIFKINGGNRKEVATSGTTAEVQYNMGSDLDYSPSGAINELVAYGVADDQSITQEVRLSLWGLQLPEWAISMESKKGPIKWKVNPLTGKLTFYGEVEILKERPGGTVSIPKRIPEVGGDYGVKIHPLNFVWELSAQPRFGDGTGLTGSFDLAGKWGATAKFGTKREKNVSATFSGEGEFYPAFRLKEVSGELAGAFEFKFPRVPLLCTWTPPCCPTGYCPYFQGSIKPEIIGTIAMEEGEPAQFYGLKFKDTELEIALTIAATVGAGSEGSIYYIAGTCGGRPSVIIQFPPDTSSFCMNEYIKQVAFDFDVKFVSECAWWKKEWEMTFNLYTCPETGAMMAMGCPSEERQILPVDRNYLNADEGYCVFPDQIFSPMGDFQLMSVGGLPDPILNVGTGPMPSVSATNDNGLLVFVYDDSGKPTGKHQEIYYARWNGSNWTAHAPLTDNLNPDFQPVAKIDPAGKELAVWVDGPEPTGAETGPRDILPGLEISYSSFDSVGGTWATPQHISSNGYADMLPWFNTKSDGTLRVCWISSPTNAIPVWHDEEIVPSLDVMASDWSGSSFGVPYTVASNLVAVSPPSVTQDSTYEYIAYLKDMDNNSGTAEDREVFMNKRLLGGSWESEQRLTDDTLSDTAAQMVINDAGIPMLTWVKRMVPLTFSDPNLNTHIDQLWYSEYEDGSWSNPELAFEYEGITEPQLFRNTAGKVVLFWVAASREFSDIYYSVYDAELMKWGVPQQITHDQGAETMISLSESGGNILASYVKRRIDMSDPYNPPVIGLSDIYLMEHVPAKDLYINNDNISFDPDPIPDVNSLISADIHLSGDFTVTDIKVDIYDGDPAVDGTLIHTQTIGQMLPGQISTVSTLWNVPNDGQAHPIYVVIDPDNTIPEMDDTVNNTAFVLPFTVNLLAQSPSAIGYPTADNVIVGFGIKNTGSMDSGSFTCQVRKGDVDGPVLFATTIDNVPAGQTVNAQFQWDVTSETAGIYDLIVIADPNNVISESQEDDNTKTGQIPLLPDLQAEQWSASIDGTTASITVRNVGAKPSDSSLVRVILDALNLGENAIPELNPGESVDVDISISQPVEIGRIDITANPDSTGMDEVSLMNNTASIILFAPADFEPDGDVDIDDLTVLAEQWLQTPGTPSADIAPEPRDNFVDLEDFARFAHYWMTDYNI